MLNCREACLGQGPPKEADFVDMNIAENRGKQWIEVYITLGTMIT